MCENLLWFEHGVSWQLRLRHPLGRRDRALYGDKMMETLIDYFLVFALLGGICWIIARDTNSGLK